jgi:hypothetical protein
MLVPNNLFWLLYASGAPILTEPFPVDNQGQLISRPGLAEMVPGRDLACHGTIKK